MLLLLKDAPTTTRERAGQPASTSAPPFSRPNNLRLPQGLGCAKCALGGQDPELRFPARQEQCAPGGATAGGTCDTAGGAAR